MTERKIEVKVDEEIGSKGNIFLSAKVFEGERAVAGVAVPRGSSPEDVSRVFRQMSEDTESLNLCVILEKAASAVPGLEEKQTQDGGKN